MNHTFDEYLDMSGIDNASLKHYGVKGQKWYDHQFGNWERHARYARGKPNPDTKLERMDKRIDKASEDYSSPEYRSLLFDTIYRDAYATAKGKPRKYIFPSKTKEEPIKYGGPYEMGVLLGSSAYLAGLMTYNKLTKNKQEREYNTKLFGPKYKEVINASAKEMDKKLTEMGIRTVSDAESIDSETAKKIDNELRKSINNAIENTYDSDEAKKYIRGKDMYGGIDPMFVGGIAAGLGGGLAITAFYKHDEKKAEKKALEELDKKRFGPRYKECKAESARVLEELKADYAKEHGISLKELNDKKNTEYEEPIFWMAYAANIHAKQNVYGDDAKKYAGIDLTKENKNSKSDISDTIKYGAYGNASSIKDVKIDSSITDRLHDMYEAAVNKLKPKVKDETLNVDPNIGLKIKTRDFTKEEDMKAVNPRFLTGAPDYTRNCMYCAAAYELRRRGYDVEANKIDCQGFDTSAVKRWFPKAKNEKIANLNELTGDSLFGKVKATTAHFFNEKNPIIQPTIDALKRQGDGARGMLFVTFEDSWGGHCIFYDVQDNKVTLRDPQSNETYKNPADFLRACDDVRCTRLDNLKIDKNGIKEAVH